LVLKSVILNYLERRTLILRYVTKFDRLGGRRVDEDNL